MSQDTIVLDVHSIIEISDGNYDNTNYRENSKMHPILGKHTRDGISTNLDADANTFISVSSHDSGDSSPLQSTQKGNAPVPPPPYTFQDSACKNENYNYAEAERRTITHQKHQQLRQQEQQSQPAVKNPKSIFKPDTDIFKFPQHSHSHKIENFSQFVRHLLHRADVSRSVYIVALIYYRRVLSKTGPNNDHQVCDILFFGSN
ncbi:hypothetical protein SARC_07006 [Sphaeroforma arctica JP610]|uniref:Uncharacterized protein n=1 Tax=Sphaeroforma arctica JP610 TaxID=667725 RepID=A0A0L0FUZ2_9EUKA|nr:hypothetical protein SARC_07006 [Sphaeroforma arctica JP610]KNC80642.1 hypothetical protein SARC_07006 [Sphaeroforma arctica JP610]|eukprot:XP_014154544.1 hypothetical protein SARC_07006 [Sphaeroforma arctica JP610]